MDSMVAAYVESMTAVYPVVWYGFKFKEPVTNINECFEISDDLTELFGDTLDLLEIADGVYLQVITSTSGCVIGLGVKLVTSTTETDVLNFAAVMALLERVQEPVQNFFETNEMPKPELYIGCETSGATDDEGGEL